MKMSELQKRRGHFDRLCELTNSFEVICHLNVLRSDLHEGNVDFI